MEHTIQLTLKLVMVVLDEVQLQSQSVRAHSLTRKVMHGEVSLIAVKFLQALVLGADVVSTGQLIQFNKEGTK